MVAVVETRRKAWSRKQALAREPQWSEYQQAIFDWVEHGTGNLQIAACAGSGKTTCLTAIVARLPQDAKIQILAFNKHIVTAMGGVHSDGMPKLPTRVGVTTAHSMGNALLARCFEGIATVDAGKYRKIARPFVAAMPVSPIKKIAAMERRDRMKYALDLVRGCHSTLCTPNPTTLGKLIAYYGIEVPAGGELLIPKIAEMLDAGEEMARRDQVIDFGDMLWLPHIWELQPTAKDWLLIDETQDANRAQLALYEKCGRNGRVIAVGDQDQAIQGFAFASPKMWGEIKTRFNAATLPLSVCYRCPTSHLDLARYFVPTIEPSPAAIEGDITVLHPDMVPSLVEPGDLVLCRFTAPLVGLCLDLIVRGVSAKVRGRELGTNLARLADVGEGNWPNFPAVITQIMGDEIAKFREEDKDDRAESSQDNLECLLKMHSHFAGKCETLAKFIAKIENLFSDNDSLVVLSTIHRSKGDEADRAWILGSNVLPYVRSGMQDWQLKQEENLTYVALTRAKQSMILVPMGQSDDETNALTNHPYGGMGVSPVLFEPAVAPSLDPAAIQPYAVGDWFSWFGNSGYVITEVVSAGESYEYKATYTGGKYHWKSDTYPHNLMQITNILEKVDGHYSKI